jgi:hypothetical protein
MNPEWVPPIAAATVSYLRHSRYTIPRASPSEKPSSWLMTKPAPVYRRGPERLWHSSNTSNTSTSSRTLRGCRARCPYCIAMGARTGRMLRLRLLRFFNPFFFFCCGGGAAGQRRLCESLSRLRRISWRGALLRKDDDAGVVRGGRAVRRLTSADEERVCRSACAVLGHGSSGRGSACMERRLGLRVSES